MPFRFNPTTGQLDLVGSSSSATSSDNILIKRTIIQDFTVPNDYTMLGRDTIIDSGITLTIDIGGELLVL